MTIKVIVAIAETDFHCTIGLEKEPKPSDIIPLSVEGKYGDYVISEVQPVGFDIRNPTFMTAYVIPKN